MRRSFLLLVALLAAAPALARQDGAPDPVQTADGVRLSLSAVLQTRATYGRSDNGPDNIDRIGVGIRRARFRARADFGTGAGLYMQIDGAGGTLTFLDFYGQMRLAEQWTLRMGRFASAQPRGFILTPVHFIDVADRAAVVERWGQATVGGDGRDFGIEAAYRTGGTDVLFFLHNGDGSWSRVRGNFRPSISEGSATDGVERTGLAATASISHRLASRPDVEIGGFAGYNGAEGPNADGRSYGTYGVHAYLGALPGSRSLRLKLDLLGIAYEEHPLESDAQNSLGASLLAAALAAPALEVFGRVEVFTADLRDEAPTGDDLYLTLGATFSPSARRGGEFHRERITLAWQRVDFGDESGTEDLVFVQLQLGF
jgi:hypothetical protein